MNRKQWLISSGIIAAAALMGSALGPGLWQAPAANAQAFAPSEEESLLPPIFQKGKVVTFGPQGPRLTILEVHGNWIHVAQNVRFGVTQDAQDVDPSELFWLHVPSIDQSWQAVD